MRTRPCCLTSHRKPLSSCLLKTIINFYTDIHRQKLHVFSFHFLTDYMTFESDMNTKASSYYLMFWRSDTWTHLPRLLSVSCVCTYNLYNRDKIINKTKATKEGKNKNRTIFLITLAVFSQIKNKINKCYRLALCIYRALLFLYPRVRYMLSDTCLLIWLITKSSLMSVINFYIIRISFKGKYVNIRCYHTILIYQVNNDSLNR